MSALLLQKTPLHALHLELGAKMTAFAGYDMPVSYPAGILAEHRHCRSTAALFDVSHMGQLKITGDTAAAALESLIPIDVISQRSARRSYSTIGSLPPIVQDPPSGLYKSARFVGPESRTPVLLYTAIRTLTVCTI